MLKRLIRTRSLIHPNTFSLKRLSNRYQLLLDYLLRREEVKGLPNTVELEVSSKCNLNCIMCPRREVKVEQNMPLDLFRRVIDQVSGSAELAILHASGEPLLNPHIFDMITYCKDHRIGTWLSTNGMLLTEERIERLLDSPLDGLVVAIDGATKATYEKIRVGGHFETVMRNTHRLLDRHRQRRSTLMISLQLIEMAENRHEIEQFRKYWHTFDNVNLMIKPMVDWSGQYEKTTKKGHGELLFEKVICDRPWNWLIVKSDGSVPYCAHDIGCKYVVANFKHSGLKEIWNAKRMQHYRRLVAQGKQYLPLCRNCEYCFARPRNIIGNTALVTLDMLTTLKILFYIGYKKTA